MLPRSSIVYARTLGKIDFFGGFCAIVLPKKGDASKRGVFWGQKYWKGSPTTDF
jgi:hypothetical protein